MSSAGKAVIGFIIGRPLVAIVIAVVVIGVGLIGTRTLRAPVTNRTEHVKLTDQQQIQLGNEEYAKTLRQNRTHIISTGPQYTQVQRVAKRIETVAAKDKPDFTWKVTLIRSKQANAFCLPGGKI